MRIPIETMTNKEFLAWLETQDGREGGVILELAERLREAIHECDLLVAASYTITALDDARGPGKG